MKLVLIFIYVDVLLKVATAYRLPRAADKKGSDESSEEFTEADLKTFQAELEKSLPKGQVDQIISVFSKFTTGKTSEENAEGFVSKTFMSSLWILIIIIDLSLSYR